MAKTASNMHYLVILGLLFVSSPICNAHDQEFLKCMSVPCPHKTPVNSTDAYVFPANSSMYTSLWLSAQQNPRWVNSTSQMPRFIITPRNESHVRDAILCSQKTGLQVRIKSGGHDYEGLSYRCNSPFIIIDLVNLRSIDINMDFETAWVGGGATIGELFYSIAEKSGVHAFPAGYFPSVGVGGHFSGGGIGSMLRKYGLAADNIIDAKIMDVDGQVLDRASMEEDLFWAIRGGGAGSFGVVLAWKIKLVHVPPVVTVFIADRMGEEGRKLIYRWQSIASQFPEDLFMRVFIQNKAVNRKRLVKASFNSFFLGTVDQLMQIMPSAFPELELKREDCMEMSWIESVMHLVGFPKGTSPKVLLDRTTLYKNNFKGKSDFADKPIPETAFEGIWKKFEEDVEQALIIMDPFGGKMDEIPESAVAFPHRKGNLYNIQYMVKWSKDGDEAAEKNLKWIKELYEYMTPYVAQSPRTAYLNYKDLDLGLTRCPKQAAVWGRKYFKGNFEKLMEVKRRIDPGNFFRDEQSIPLLI